jgi:hypothetical protein
VKNRLGNFARVWRAVFHCLCVVLLPFVISAQESLSLSWDTTADTNAIGYNLYYGVSSRNYTKKFSFGENTNATVTGLVAGTTYFFAVTASDSWGDESDFSNEISYKVPAVSQPPPPTLTNSGTYSGLFSEPDALRPQSAGAFKLSISTRGTYSGSLQMGTARLPFSGVLNPSFQAANQIPRKNTNALALSFSLGPSNRVNGSLSDGTWTANLYGERTASSAPTNNASKYTLVIQGNTVTSPSLGNSFGVFTVNSAATVKFNGKLADGTKLNQSASFTESGKWPFYVSLYSGNGVAMGWLTFANGRRDGLTGVLSWIKPPSPTSPLYPGGLAVQCATFRSIYNPGATLSENLTVANLVFGGTAADNPTDSLLKVP